MGAEMSIKAMKQALEALETHASIGIKADKAITALQQAISAAEKQELVILAAEQEPVTLKVNGIPPFKNPPNDVIDAAFHVTDWAHRNNWVKWRIGYCCSVDFTAPPQRTWIGLTDAEIADIANLCRWSNTYHADFARAIEAKLREKNGE
jgi:hypothetical protein